MRKLALTTAALIGLVTPAVAEQNSTWKDLHLWHIGVTGDTHDCFMMTSYANHHSVLRFAIDRSRKSLDMMFVGEGWNSLQEGEHYQMSFQFGSNSHGAAQRAHLSRVRRSFSASRFPIPTIRPLGLRRKCRHHQTLLFPTLVAQLQTGI